MRALQGEDEDVIEDAGDDEGEGSEFETVRSISKNSSAFPCATFVEPFFRDYSISSLFSFTFYHYFLKM